MSDATVPPVEAPPTPPPPARGGYSAPAPLATPVAVPIAGGITLLVGLVSLCGGAMRLVQPDSGVAPEIFSDAFQSASLRHAFYFSMSIWIALAFLAISAGGGLVASWKPARRIAAVWAWLTIAADLGIALLYASRVIPALVDASVPGGDLARLVLAVPAAGCCPTVWALGLLAIVYHDGVIAWSRRAAAP